MFVLNIVNYSLHSVFTDADMENILTLYICIYKVVIYVCMFFCLSDHNSGTHDWFASNFDWGHWWKHGNVLCLFWDSKLSGLAFIAKS